MIKSILAAALVLGLGSNALAQTQAPKADPQQAKQVEAVTDKAAAEIKAVREQIQKDRNAIVAASMNLSDKDAAAFWPLYAEYRAAMTKAVGDRMTKLIVDYAASYKTLTNEQATKLTTESFAIRKAEAEAKAAWYPKFAEKVSGKTATRFFQVDNKLDAIIMFQLAAEIPLAE